MTCEAITTALTALGLLATFTGALIAAFGSMFKDKQAAYHATVQGFGGVDKDANLNAPFVEDQMRRSTATRNGLFVIAFGTFLQLVALFLPFSGLC